MSGLPYEAGLEAVERLRPLLPAGASLTQTALRWILMFDEVTCAIPGARTPAQARENAGAASQHALPAEFMAAARELYDSHVRKHVHHRW
jgi:aryl-alcohol dehydrogenase-like predicted oxidoreductase